MKTINSEVARCIKSIGEDLINRADDIANDLDNAVTIKIIGEISADEIINYDVIKNYRVKDFIHYNELDGEQNLF